MVAAYSKAPNARKIYARHILRLLRLDQMDAGQHKANQQKNSPHS
jgi:hypothetical protein